MRKILFLLALFLCPIMGQAAYLGGGTGTATLDVDTSGADRVDDEDGYLKLLGGTEIHPNVDIEFGYVDFGEYMAHYPEFDETNTARATAFTVSGLANASLTQNLSAYFRFGMHFWNAEFDVDGFDPFIFGSYSGSGDGSGNSTYLGAGIDLTFGEKLSIRFETEKYKDVAKGMSVELDGIGSIELKGSDVDLFGVALVFKLE